MARVDLARIIEGAARWTHRAYSVSSLLLKPPFLVSYQHLFLESRKFLSFSLLGHQRAYAVRVNAGRRFYSIFHLYISQRASEIVQVERGRRQSHRLADSCCCDAVFSLHVLTPVSAFQAVRCQVLDYFFRQRECLRDDHVLFSFEQSMTFSKAEFSLIDQVSSCKSSHCPALS